MDGKRNKHDDHKLVIKNKYFLSEERQSSEDPALSLKHLQEMFADCLDADVVEIVFAECAMNVDKSLENLLVLSQESNSRVESCCQVGSILQSSSNVKKTDFASVVRSKPDAMSSETKSTSNSSKECNIVAEVMKCIKENVKVIVLMRGLPGSGKSTLASDLVRHTNGEVFSTDDYFTSKNGIFQYDWSKLEEAHQWNQTRASAGVKNGTTPIFIDNTNLEEWEMRPYLIMGYNSGYKIYILEPNTFWKYKTSYLAKCNKHGIKKEKIEKMKDRFDRSLTVEKMIENLKRHKKCEVQKRERSNSKNEEPPSKIDLELLMVLNENNTDSESSSRNPSENGSYVGQEGFWEKDEEFTYSDMHASLESTIASQVNCSLPKAQRQRLSKQTRASEKCELTDWCTTTEVSTHVQCKRLLGSVSMQNNWEFPPFPNEVGNEVKEKENDDRFVYNNCVSTQTEKMDWGLLEIKQSGFENTEEIFGISNYVSKDVIVLPVNKNSRIITMDRGTSTDDIPGDLTFDEKVTKLKSFFKKAPETHLREVLNACHEDVDWAFNLLSEFSDEHFASPEISQKQLVKLKETKETETSFALKLDPAFCDQLQNVFGSVTDNSITQNGTVVNVSHGVAKLLHHLWKKSLKKQLPENLMNDNLNGGDCIQREPTKMQNRMPTNFIQAPQSSLKEIMDLEMALNLSWNEYYENDTSESNKDLLSTKLKREQLYNSYPGIERQILDELFEANSFRLSDTISVIDQSLGVSASFTAGTEIWVTAETVSNNSNSRVKSCIPFDYFTKTEESNKNEEEEMRDIRAKMLQFYRKRKELVEKARENYARKKYAVASFYSSQARDYQTQIETASKQVIENILSATTSHELDLHGLHSCEVLTTVSTYLRLKLEEAKRNKMKHSYVDIVTGWGAHSSSAPTIKPMVLNYLKSKKFKYQMQNPGVIRVKIVQ